MTQEQKQILLVDLCARLPYRVKTSSGYSILELSPRTDVIYLVDNGDIPYLRPMSSMTEEEREELEHLSDKYFSIALDKQIQESLSSQNRNESKILEYIASSVIIDWLNAHHFDYRGLISMGLGIDCTGLNIYENEKSI